MKSLRSDQRSSLALAAVICALIFLPSFSQAASQKRLKGVIQGTNCETLLALKESPTVSADDAKGSLLLLRSLLKNKVGLHTSAPSYGDFKLKASSLRSLTSSHPSLKKAAGRIEGIVSDSIDLGGKGTYVAFEVRGRENIRSAIAQSEAILAEIHQSIQSVENTRSQDLKIQQIVDASLLLIVGSTIVEPFLGGTNSAALTDAIIASLSTLGYLATIGPVKEDIFFDAKFSKHLTAMKEALSETGGHDVLAYGTSAKIHADYHQEVMSCTPEQLADSDVRREACQDAWLGWVDTLYNRITDVRSQGGLMSSRMAQDVRYPQGKWRYMYLDQFYFMDEQYNEPVWVIVYRSFKDKPHPPKKPKETKERRLKPSWAGEGDLAPVHAK